MEAEGSACLAAALRAGRRVRLPFDSLDLFADGVSVAQVGREPFRIARTCVDGVITVSVDEICAAIKDVFDDTRSIAEPAGALAVAGRAFGSKPELLFRFEFPERPGALLRFLNGLGSNWNITMFHYRNHGAAWGRVLAGFEGNETDRARLSTYLERIGYRYWEETGNPAVELFLR